MIHLRSIAVSQIEAIFLFSFFLCSIKKRGTEDSPDSPSSIVDGYRKKMS